MTRGDWNTYPDTVTDVTPTTEMKKQMDGKVYTKPSDAPDITSFKKEVKNNIKFVDMRNVAFDDNDQWDKFIDQLSVGELCQIPGDKRGNDAMPSVAYPPNMSGNGPDGLQNGVLNVSEVVIASSMNKELIAERGFLMAEDAYRVGYTCVYGPGANIHRAPYSGRNSEYYSEDSIMSYYCSALQVGEMSRKGVLTAIKHFAANDQETNRHGVATFMTEQTLREVPLKGFEGAFTKGGSLEVMTSYNRIGCVPAAAHSAVMIDVLRGEWGFKGINLTDSAKDTTTYMYTAECLVNGTDVFLNDAARSGELRKMLVTDRDGYVMGKLRVAAKHFFYAYSRSFVINGLDSTTEVENFVPWWQPALIGLNIGIGVILLAAVGMFLYSAYFKKKEVEKIY